DKENVIIFKKVFKDEEIYVILNNQDEAKSVSVPTTMNQMYRNLMTDEEMIIKNRVKIAPLSALLLVPVK
ncbi:alpha-glycosidase, partial [Turicibacter sanguinis]|nr:alpha-glycosidase [Turicibacter sanguinis]